MFDVEPTMSSTKQVDMQCILSREINMFASRPLAALHSRGSHSPNPHSRWDCTRIANWRNWCAASHPPIPKQCGFSLAARVLWPKNEWFTLKSRGNQAANSLALFRTLSLPKFLIRKASCALRALRALDLGHLRDSKLH